MPETYTLDFLQLEYRADLQVVVGRWMRQASLAELQQGYQALLEVAAPAGCRGWLLDARRRNNTDPGIQRWLISGFLDGAAARLGGRVRLAYLLPPPQLRDLAADGAFPPAAFFADKPYDATRFVDERQAVEWLQTGRHSGPAPLGQAAKSE
ncbi:hypothetical protein [Hymenobacter algoricola]|uniref:STAS/SEC14 domain-containing protein n=1 Tax=Hymenobacter algoricola TaxID=486267 RepID=A0ABP7N935_9BACT